MGASSWHYETAYREDAEEALQELRQQVFESGRYGHHFANVSVWRLFRELPLLFALIMVAFKCFFEISAFVSLASRGFRRPRTIEEAIEMAAENGTHSILDIEHVSRIPDLGVACPLSPNQTRKIYGNAEPTVEDLNHFGWDAAAEDLERWQAVYFPVFTDGIPTKLVFAGCSGD